MVVMNAEKHDKIFSINDGLFWTTKDYEKGNVLLEENSPEEIKNLVLNKLQKMGSIKLDDH